MSKISEEVQETIDLMDEVSGDQLRNLADLVQRTMDAERVMLMVTYTNNDRDVNAMSFADKENSTGRREVAGILSFLTKNLTHMLSVTSNLKLQFVDKTTGKVVLVFGEDGVEIMPS